MSYIAFDIWSPACQNFERREEELLLLVLGNWHLVIDRGEDPHVVLAAGH